ncbi:MAG: DUF2339 domain-containing protein, partial [Myxococcales bacterium]|nr:DUF2339 domain-containing protein [Myxococcales bacterium]
VYFSFAALLLYDEHRAWLGLVSVLATIHYAFVSSRLVRQPVIDAHGLRVFAGTAAGFLLLATPFLAKGPVITIVWCAETVFLAWACTQPSFGFLRAHVFAMLGIISVRLIGFDHLLAPDTLDPQRRYIPFAQLASYPPFVAAVSFALVARLLGRLGPLPGRGDAGLSARAAAWVLGAGLFVLMAAMDAEAFRLSRYALAPQATRELQHLIEAGLLVTAMSALWFGVVKRLAGAPIPSMLGLGFALLLSVWVLEALAWHGSYSGMLRILGDGYGLWWLHLGTFLMLPLVLLFAAVGASLRAPLGRLSAEQLQLACFGAALIIGMLLLRREVFAITHAPPVADFFPGAARLASYRMLLSMSYAFLAFGIYLHAVRAASRPRLHAAYALYVVTAFKVYVFDLESQNQLYRACSLLVFAAILFVSSYFANRQGSVTAEQGKRA